MYRYCKKETRGDTCGAWSLEFDEALHAGRDFQWRAPMRLFFFFFFFFGGGGGVVNVWGKYSDMQQR